MCIPIDGHDPRTHEASSTSVQTICTSKEKMGDQQTNWKETTNFIQMKITIEPYSGGTYQAQNDAEHISEVINMFKGLLVSCGYHPVTVDEMFCPTAVEPWDITTDNQDTPIHICDDAQRVLDKRFNESEKKDKSSSKTYKS